MDESQPARRADLDTFVTRIVEAFTANLSELRNEMMGQFNKLDERFDKVDEGFDTVLQRLDRIETKLTTIQMQISGQ